MSVNQREQGEHDMALHIETSGVHHLALRVTDLARARRFYAGVLGFPVALEGPGIFLFLAGSTAIAVRGPDEATEANDRFNPFRVGLDHIALACGSEAELTRVAGALAAAEVDNTGIRLDATLNRHYVAFKDPDRIAWEFYMAPDLARAAALSYFEGLRTRDLETIAFADDVSFDSPLVSGLKGAGAVRAFLRDVLPAIRDVRVQSVLTSHDSVAVRFDLHTAAGVVPAVDWFRIAHGRIAEMRPFFDPRPLLAPA
jgi:glyoxylase I family protein